MLGYSRPPGASHAARTFSATGSCCTTSEMGTTHRGGLLAGRVGSAELLLVFISREERRARRLAVTAPLHAPLLLRIPQPHLTATAPRQESLAAAREGRVLDVLHAASGRSPTPTVRIRIPKLIDAEDLSDRLSLLHASTHSEAPTVILVDRTAERRVAGVGNS